jgi:enediyne biosynthesis protein E4
MGCTSSSEPPASPASTPSRLALPPTDVSLPRPSVPLANENVPALIPAQRSVGVPQFADRHADWNLSFEYDTGASGKALMVESTGGGGGWIDFDRDGWQDLFLVQGGDPQAELPHETGDRLLRNLSGEQFFDVTDFARPPDHGYGQGLAVGDFNGDGFEDLFVTNTGPDVLLVNQGDGTFQDATELAKLGDPRWGSSAAWFDLDDDEDLDLFVCNYLKYDVDHPVSCQRDDGTPAICHPETIDPEASECYANLGDGRFEPVTDRWGLRAGNNKALGVVIADFNGDDQPDVFVANDVSANHFFVRQKPGQFEEQAVAMGCAYNALGQYQANMGIACHDYDNNGFLDLYVTHFTHDSNTLYANLGEVGFRDVTRYEGLHTPTVPLLGFGTVMADFNADGAMDLFVANGHIDDWRFKGELWKMRQQMFSFNGREWIEHFAATAGPFFEKEYLGRAVSAADVDRDGDLDLLVVFQHAPAALLINESPRGAWLEIDLVAGGLNRRGVGAKVTVEQGRQRWIQQHYAGGSYCAAHEPLLHFVLEDSAAPCRVTVEFAPLPGRTVIQEVSANQRVTIRAPSSEEGQR